MSIEPLCFLYMTKKYRSVEKNNEGVNEKILKDIIKNRNYLPFTRYHFFSLFKNISAEKKVYYIFFLGKNWMNQYCGGREVGEIDLNKNFKLIYTCNEDKIKKYLNKSKTIVVRGNYPEWNTIVDFRKKVIFIPCWSRIKPNNLKVDLDKRTSRILVDEDDIAKPFRDEGFMCEVFQKPAAEFYYEEVEREDGYDFCFVCANASREHKRFDLLLDSILRLDSKAKSKIRFALAGNFSSHLDRISKIKKRLKNVDLELLGGKKRINRNAVRRLLNSCKFLACTSSIDANPRVIGESLACGTPVLVLSDLAGGKFQVKSLVTGEIAAPNKDDIASKMLFMLKNNKKYRARENCITINDAKKQMYRLLKS
jgi:glycosyltransferase involved in cell wall biosynthesis